MAAPVALLKKRGLLVGSEDGSFLYLRQRETPLMKLHEKAREYVGRLEPLPPTELEDLANRLESARDSLLADPLLAPRPGSHLAGSHSLATFTKDAPPMVRIEQAILDLWMARDDAHIRAWQNADMDGPTEEVLTVLWLGEHSMVPELKEALKSTHTPESIDASLEYLADNDYAVRGVDDMIELTPAGVLVRHDIERETDRIYFDSLAPHLRRGAVGVLTPLSGW